MLDLKPEYLTLVKSILATHAPHQTALAYGSRVKGLAHSGSDLDLVVIDPLTPETPQKNLMVLRNAFKNSELPIFVEVQDWALLPATFRDEIQKKNVTLQVFTKI